MVKIEEDIKLDFNDVLIKPKRSTLSSRKEVDVTREFKTLHSKKNWEGIPVMVANMDSIATFDMLESTKKHKIMTCIHKHYTVDEWKEWYFEFGIQYSDEDFNYVSVSTGISEADFQKTKEILANCPKIWIITLDVANGYQESFVDTVKKYRKEFPDKFIIAGNVCTSEMTEQLIISGADCCKIGIGGGSVCRTRAVAGCGQPQLSAILECADAAHGLGGLIISDGGITCPGDMAKAFSAGADFCMCGSIFSGCDEGYGEIIEQDGKKVKLFYGMSSKEAMDKWSGGLKNYRSSEGKCVSVPYKGPVENVILEYLGGVRSACTYVGAARLKELSKRTTFFRVNNQLNTVYGNSK